MFSFCFPSSFHLVFLHLVSLYVASLYCLFLYRVPLSYFPILSPFILPIVNKFPLFSSPFILFPFILPPFILPPLILPSFVLYSFIWIFFILFFIFYFFPQNILLLGNLNVVKNGRLPAWVPLVGFPVAFAIFLNYVFPNLGVSSRISGYLYFIFELFISQPGYLWSDFYPSGYFAFLYPAICFPILFPFSVFVSILGASGRLPRYSFPIFPPQLEYF